MAEELEHTIEELGSANEEMKASNEEITSINEELRSTNEELETSKEKLQSLNEELDTVNHQLQGKVEELTRSIQLLQDVAEVANEADTVGEALHKTLQHVCETWQWPLGHACLPDETDSQTFVSGGVWYSSDRDRLSRLMEFTGLIRFHRDSWLVGRVIATAKPEWITNISDSEQDSRAKHLKDAGISSAAAFPILVQQRVVGVLEFFNVQPTEPTDLLRQGMAQIGTQLGRVVERVELQREITRLADEDQRRFAQELHDSIAQQLTGLSMMAESCRQDLHESGSPVAARVARLVDQIRELQGQVRNLAHGLMPVEVDAEGLMAALHDLAEQTTSMTGILCRFECAKAVRVDDSITANHLYHIVQESIHNSLKHAKARQIIVRVEQTPQLDVGGKTLLLTVQDDGTGFIPEANSDGMGQRVMRYRARLIGAMLEVRSHAGHGTTVLCRVVQQEKLSG